MDIKSSMDCSEVSIEENGPDSTVSVMSTVQELRRRLCKAVKDTRLLNDQDVDKIAEHTVASEGEQMVADDDNKGSITVSLVNLAKLEERKNIEGMAVFDRKMTGVQGAQDEMGRHEHVNS